MSDRDALYAAICANPDEDAPRLALADWLEENGPTEADRAHGEYIRLSFEMWQLPEESPEHEAAVARFHELHARYPKTWFAPLSRYVQTYWTSRGFVDGVSISGQQITQWDRHIRWCPTIRHLVMRHCRGRLGPILASPLTAKIETLDLGGVNTADLEALAAAPHLRKLKLLKLHWATVDDILTLLRSPVLPITKVVLAWYGNDFRGSLTVPNGLTVWATSFSMRWQYPHLPRLWACPQWAKVRSLLLVWRQSQNQGIVEPLGDILERAEHLTGLRDLALSGNGLDDAQVRALTRCPSLNALERLHLAHNRIGDEGVEAIVERWPNLTELALAENAIGSRGAQAIAKSTTRLETLDLETNNIFLPGMVALAQSPRLARLKVLNLDGNPGDSLGASILAASPHLKPGVVKIKTDTPIKSDTVLEELVSLPESSAITVLRLRDHGITDRGLAAIARNKYLTGVTELDMYLCDISKDGLDALAQWPGLRTLKTFQFSTSVNYRCCSGKDFDKLLRSPHWGELEYFKLPAGHRLHDAGITALAAAKFAPTLLELELGDHRITVTGAKALARAGNFRSVRKLDLGWYDTISPKGVVAIVSAEWPSVEEFQAGKLSDEELKALAKSRGFPVLAQLNLSGEKLTKVGVRALAKSPLFPRLTALQLGGKNLDDGAIRALVDAPKRPTKLVRLMLDFKTTLAGVARLVGAPLVKGVTELNLGDAELGPELGRLIAASRYLTRVTTLNLDGNALGDEGVLALIRAKHLPALKELYLGQAGCTEACLDELAAAPLLKQLERVSVSFEGKNAKQLKEMFKERLGAKADPS